VAAKILLHRLRHNLRQRILREVFESIAHSNAPSLTSQFVRGDVVPAVAISLERSGNPCGTLGSGIETVLPPQVDSGKSGESASSRGAVRGSAEDHTACARAGRSAKRSLTESVEKGKEIGAVARLRRMARDDARKVFLLWRAVSCGSRDQQRWRTELDFGSSQSFEDHHRSATLGTKPRRPRYFGSGCSCSVCSCAIAPSN
jgi:hypothetical protein